MFGGIVTNLAFMSLFFNDHPVIERSNTALASASHSSSITAMLEGIDMPSSEVSGNIEDFCTK